MTSINKNNIEKWLFDYHEGNLNQEEREALEKFVLLNPEYEAEMDAWSMAYVENEEFEYHNTESLYQKKRRIGWVGWSSAAAILLSGIVLSFLFLSQPEENKLQFSLASQSEMNPNKSDQLSNSATANSDNNLVHHPDVNTADPNSKPSVPNHMLSAHANEKADFHVDQNIYKNNNCTDIKNPNSNAVVLDASPNKKNAIEDLNVAKSNLKAENQLNDSNGQNHADARPLVVNAYVANNKNEEELIKNNKSNDGLISAIPGNNDPLIVDDEFAHLEPVQPKLEKDITLYQALDKLDYDSGDHAGTYNSNPEYAAKKIDLTTNLKSGSRSPSTKFIRDLKRAFNNPSGVTNLRDPNLVIPGYDPLSFNPSLAGGMLKTRIQGSYMNQWTGTGQMQHMAQFSVDGYVYGMRGGIGMNLQFSDFSEGMYRNYDASLMYSPKINFGKFLTIEPSVKFNMGAYTLDRDKVQPGSQIEIERGNIYQTFESGETPIGTKKMYYDLGVGLFVNTKWFYAGFSMDNLFRHKANIYSNDMSNPRRAPYRINAVIGTDFESRNKNFSGSPFIVYQHYDVYDEFYFGSNFRFYWGTAGVSISDKGNISAQAGIQFKKFKMMYQYDWTKSKLMGIRGHSHELMFRFTIKPKRSLVKNLEY